MLTMYPTIPTVLKDGTQLPRYAHEGDAGLDLCATEDVTLYPGEWKMVGSGVSCAIPERFVGLVVPRSGMGCKGLVLKNVCGVIDSTYRGEIGLTLFNNNPTHSIFEEVLETDEDGNPMRVHVHAIVNRGQLHVHKGDRVAQLLIVPVAQASLVEVDTLNDTERSDGGFGSSGVRL